MSYIKPPSAGEVASQFFTANDNRMVMLTKDVQLIRGGEVHEVNQPWIGDELVNFDNTFSTWYKTLIGRLRDGRHICFTLIYPKGTTAEEAAQCAKTYMLLLNLVRVPPSRAGGMRHVP